MRLMLPALLFSAVPLAAQAAAPASPPASVAEAIATARTASEDARLLAVFRDDSAREEADNPFAKIYRGESPDPAALAKTYTDAQLRAVRKSLSQSMAALNRIDRRKLGPAQQISYDAFLFSKRQDAAMLQPDMVALTAVRPFNHFGGLHMEFATLVSSDGSLKYETSADYRRNLDVIRVFPVIMANAEARFRQGLDTGVVESRLTVTNMIAQIDALLAQKTEESPYLSPVRTFPAGVPEADRPALKAAYEAALRDEVMPAYRKFRAFLNDEYLPAAREQVGISAMKGGPGLYRHLIEQQTTLKLDPEAVHTLGLSEVARIQHEMDGVKRELGYSGDLKSFFEEIRTNPRYHPKTREELAQGFAKVAKRVDELVPQYFSRVPKTKLLIEPYPAYREKYEAGGSYNQGSPDGTRPGIFFYNSYDLPSRFLTGITTLYLHEGAPGHHFQISLALEDKSLPDFQRFGGNNAYVEGWALYSETLGYSMGFYKDPMQHWGTLDDEMLRAMRLVVDTGLHAKGWTREQANAYMLANSGMGKSDATAEVERYIAWPGQALGYKIGALTIQRLRKKSEAALGARFDIRKFHEQVLGSGALPLPILEAKIDRWIAASQH